MKRYLVLLTGAIALFVTLMMLVFRVIKPMDSPLRDVVSCLSGGALGLGEMVLVRYAWKRYLETGGGS